MTITEGQYAGWERIDCGPRREPRAAAGPGDHLKATLGRLGIKPGADCSCNEWIEKMNAWGIAGCREHLDEIATRLHDAAAELGWLDTLKATALAAKERLVLNPFDPYRSLVNLAIDLADRKLPAIVSRGGSCGGCGAK